MPNYKQGKIYSIRSHKTDNIYIGSTTQCLSKRMGAHRKDYKRWKAGKPTSKMTSFEILQHGDAYIELIELYPCTCKAELNKQEGKYIREMDCVNKVIPDRTKKEYQKKYYEDHKDRLKPYTKQYQEENKDKIQKQRKQYYGDNKQKILTQKKQYYQANKQKILSQMKQNINCPCGSTVRKDSMSKHKRSKKHRNYTNSLLF